MVSKEEQTNKLALIPKGRKLYRIYVTNDFKITKDRKI